MFLMRLRESTLMFFTKMLTFIPRYLPHVNFRLAFLGLFRPRFNLLTPSGLRHLPFSFFRGFPPRRMNPAGSMQLAVFSLGQELKVIKRIVSAIKVLMMDVPPLWSRPICLLPHPFVVHNPLMSHFDSWSTASISNGAFRINVLSSHTDSIQGKH